MIHASFFVGVTVALGLLLYGGILHLAHLNELRVALVTHGIIPRGLIAPVAFILGVTELALGGAGVVAVNFHLDATPPVLLSASATYTVFAIYGTVVRSRDPEAVCACTAQPTTMNIWVISRAWVLAGILGSGAILAASVEIAAMVGFEFVVAMLGSLGLGAIAWQFPLALEIPTGLHMSEIGATWGS